MATIPRELSISLIKNTLHAATNNLGQLCRHVNINMWASKRPYDRQTGTASYITHFNIPEFTTPAVVPTSGWSPRLPQGGEKSPFKMGDFVGYNHDEGIPLGVKKTDLSIPAIINPNTDVIRIKYTKGLVSFLQDVTSQGCPYGVYIEGTNHNGAKCRFYSVDYDGCTYISFSPRGIRKIFPQIEKWNLTLYFVVILVRKYALLQTCPDGTPFRLFPAQVHQGVEYINKVPLKFSAYYEYIEVTFSIMPSEPAGYFCPSDTVLDYVVIAYKKDGSSENLGSETNVEVWREPGFAQDFRKDIYSYIEIRVREPGSRKYPNAQWYPVIQFSGSYRTIGDPNYDLEYIFTFRGGESDCDFLIKAFDSNARPD